MMTSRGEIQRCTAHEWAINADNSGECMRCGLKVSGVEDAKKAPRCKPHWVLKSAGWKKEDSNE